MKIILAITGASGSIYAQMLLNSITMLKDQVRECVLIFSNNGQKVWKFEIGDLPKPNDFNNIRIADCDNMFDAVASGSSGYDSMIIAPCSMGTAGRIAAGTSDNLIVRAADVMLKEKRSLILVTRESPMSAVHLKNLKILEKAGALIMPASPFFYHHPTSIHELLQPFVGRILEKAGLKIETFRWGNDE